MSERCTYLLTLKPNETPRPRVRKRTDALLFTVTPSSLWTLGEYLKFTSIGHRHLSCIKSLMVPIIVHVLLRKPFNKRKKIRVSRCRKILHIYVKVL